MIYTWLTIYQPLLVEMACDFRQQSMTRLRWDDFRHMDDMRITSYAGRYAINVPAANCPTTFFPNPTIRLQKNGDSWPTGQWKTDVESDLKGINRLGNRVRAGDFPVACPDGKGVLYNPDTNKFNNMPLEAAPDGAFPMIFGRLENQPCTLRGTGWNRWDPLFHNPQETFETPFDFFIPSRTIDKEKCKKH